MVLALCYDYSVYFILGIVDKSSPWDFIIGALLSKTEVILPETEGFGDYEF